MSGAKMFTKIKPPKMWIDGKTYNIQLNKHNKPKKKQKDEIKGLLLFNKN